MPLACRLPSLLTLLHADADARSIKDINDNCLDVFRTHWQCLDNHNQQLWNCRSEERRLNTCVFDKLVCLNYYPEKCLSYLRVCGRFYMASVVCYGPASVVCSWLTCPPEVGEDDTRCAQGRGACPPAHAQHFCFPLGCIIRGIKNQTIRTSNLAACRHLLIFHVSALSTPCSVLTVYLACLVCLSSSIPPKHMPFHMTS